MFILVALFLIGVLWGSFETLLIFGGVVALRDERRAEDGLDLLDVFFFQGSAIAAMIPVLEIFSG